jgi:hypothetical protein
MRFSSAGDAEASLLWGFRSRNRRRRRARLVRRDEIRLQASHRKLLGRGARRRQLTAASRPPTTGSASNRSVGQPGGTVVRGRDLKSPGSLVEAGALHSSCACWLEPERRPSSIILAERHPPHPAHTEDGGSASRAVSSSVLKPGRQDRPAVDRRIRLPLRRVPATRPAAPPQPRTASFLPLDQVRRSQPGPRLADLEIIRRMQRASGRWQPAYKTGLALGARRPSFSSSNIWLQCHGSPAALPRELRPTGRSSNTLSASRPTALRRFRPSRRAHPRVADRGLRQRTKRLRAARIVPPELRVSPPPGLLAAVQGLQAQPGNTAGRSVGAPRCLIFLPA